MATQVTRRWLCIAGLAGLVVGCGASGGSSTGAVSAGGGPKPGETASEPGSTDGDETVVTPGGSGTDAGAGTMTDAGTGTMVDATRGLTCDDAIPLTPGASVTGQDTPGAGGVANTACRASDAGQRFYSFRLPPNTRATVTVTPAKPFTAVVRVMVSCSATDCITDQQSPTPGAPVSVVVDSPGDETVTKIVTVSGLDANDGGSFAIRLMLGPVSMGDRDAGTGGGAGDGGGSMGTGDAPAPRPIAPLSTASVTSQRPTLHWSLPAGAVGARVDVCADRACNTVEASFDATGTSGAPVSTLTRGAHFWRLHGLDAGGRSGPGSSATWEFFVGARSAAVDASWGSTPDFNGDGAPDLVGVGGKWDSTFTTTIPVWDVFENTGHGLPERPTYSLDYATGTARNAGDLNGDGFGDLAVARPSGMPYRESVDVYYGGPGHFSLAAMTTIDGDALGMTGAATGVGDVNGDGYGDVMASTGTGQGVFYGGPAGVATTPGTVLARPALSYDWGSPRMFAVGDVNADGYADIVVTYHGGDAEASMVYLHLGGPAGPTPDGVALGRFAYWAGAGGSDVNGDGYADVGVVGPGSGTASVYLGGAAGPSATPSATFMIGGHGPDFGSMIAGDFDGDGYGDFASYHFNADVNATVSIIHGGPSGPTLAPDLVYADPTVFNAQVSYGIGDQDGDGYDDLLLAGSTGAPGVSGRAVGVVRGGTTGLTTTIAPVLTWDGSSYSTGGVALGFTSTY